MATNVKKGEGSNAIPSVYKPGKAEETVITPKTIESDRSKASGKAKMNFKHEPLGVGQENGQSGKMKTRAYTPGGPSGS